MSFGGTCSGKIVFSAKISLLFSSLSADFATWILTSARPTRTGFGHVLAGSKGVAVGDEKQEIGDILAASYSADEIHAHTLAWQWFALSLKGSDLNIFHRAKSLCKVWDILDAITETIPCTVINVEPGENTLTVLTTLESKAGALRSTDITTLDRHIGSHPFCPIFAIFRLRGKNKYVSRVTRGRATQNGGTGMGVTLEEELLSCKGYNLTETTPHTYQDIDPHPCTVVKKLAGVFVDSRSPISVLRRAVSVSFHGKTVLHFGRSICFPAVDVGVLNLPLL